MTDPEILNDIYNSADLFILPSLAENLPNTIVEALLCGVPVTAFNVGGIPELVNQSNGQLAKAMNPVSLSHAIHDVLSSPDRFRKEHIASAAKKIFDTDAIIAAHLKVYESLLSRY